MKQFTIDENAYFAINNNEGVVLNMKTGIYFGLNELGAEVWAMIEDGLDFNEMIKCFLNTYDISESDLISDVNEIILKLRDFELVKIHDLK